MVMAYQLAVSLGNTKLCEPQIRVLIKDVLKSEGFLQCSHEMVESILHLDGLQCNEIDLFEGVIEWAKSSCQRNGLDANDSNDLKQQLDSCFSLIRFGATSGADIGKILSNEVYKNLFTQDELIDVMQQKVNPGYKSKYFESAPRSKHLDFNESTQLICQREIPTDPYYQIPFFLKKNQPTWFYTNQPVLLKRINFCSIRHPTTRGEADFSLCADIEIFEYNFKSLTFWGEPGKILSSIQSVKVGKNKDWILASPIAINPGFIYEVRVTLLEDISNFQHKSSWVQKVNLNEKIEITFHQKSKKDDDARLGLVSSLIFHSP